MENEEKSIIFYLLSLLSFLLFYSTDCKKFFTLTKFNHYVSTVIAEPAMQGAVLLITRDTAKFPIFLHMHPFIPL